MAKTEDSIGMFDEIRAYRMQKADGKTSVIERTLEEMEFSEACEALVKADRKFRKLDVMVKLNPWTDAGAWFDALEERYKTEKRVWEIFTAGDRSRQMGRLYLKFRKSLFTGLPLRADA
jgi:hypothetical protein